MCSRSPWLLTLRCPGDEDSVERGSAADPGRSCASAASGRAVSQAGVGGVKRQYCLEVARFLSLPYGRTEVTSKDRVSIR